MLGPQAPGSRYLLIADGLFPLRQEATGLTLSLNALRPGVDPVHLFLGDCEAVRRVRNGDTRDVRGAPGRHEQCPQDRLISLRPLALNSTCDSGGSRG